MAMGWKSTRPQTLTTWQTLLLKMSSFIRVAPCGPGGHRARTTLSLLINMWRQHYSLLGTPWRRRGDREITTPTSENPAL